MPITAITLENFRAFSKPTRFELRPITLLVGPNNSGKSSVTKALSMLQATLHDRDAGQPGYSDARHQLGGFRRIHNRRSGSPIVTFQVEWQDAGKEESSIGLLLSYDDKRLVDCQILEAGEAFFGFDFTGAHTDSSLGTIEGYDVWFKMRREDLEHGEWIRMEIASALRLSAEKESFLELWDEGAWERIASVATNCVSEGLPVPVDWENDLEHNSQAKPFYFDLILGNAFDQVMEAFDRELDEDDIPLWRYARDYYYRPHVDRAFDRLHSALGPQHLRSVAASLPFAPPLVVDGDGSHLARLLRAFYDTPEAASRLEKTASEGQTPPMDGTTWLCVFGIGDDLKVERVADAGYAAYISRKEWEAFDLTDAPPATDSAAFFVHLLRKYATQEQIEHLKAQHIDGSNSFNQALTDILKAQRDERESVLPLGGRLLLSDLGFGYTRLLVILLEGLLNRTSESLLVLEEPETNLHPNLQSKLADLFVDMAGRGQRLLVETHSEYLIRKLQYLVATGQAKPEDIVIYYLGPDPTADDHVREITLDERGALSQPFGPGFYDEATNLMADLFRFQARN